MRINILETLSERHKANRVRIKHYSRYENLDGTPISRGHAATALSNARKEQLVVELIIELIEASNIEHYNLSERAIKGLYKLTEPVERHFVRAVQG
jgi:hypothetical protein